MLKENAWHKARIKRLEERLQKEKYTVKAFQNEVKKAQATLKATGSGRRHQKMNILDS